MTASRRACCYLSVVFGVAIVYGSLLPFNGRLLSLDEAWRAYLGLGGGTNLRFSLTDYATNLLIFAPFAFAMQGCLRPGRSALAAALLAVMASALLSAGIEFAQLFFPPRNSSVYDFVANTSGAILGVFAWEALGARAGIALAGLSEPYVPPDDVRRRHRRIILLLTAPYAVALGAADGWFTGSWYSLGHALSRLGDISLLPFYEHQQANIVLALASMLWQFGLYLPLGMARRMQTGASTPDRNNLMIAGVWGASVAAVMEAGKLFLPGKLPDVGDLLIAAVAAVSGFVLLPSLLRVTRERNDVAPLSQESGDAAPSHAAKAKAPAGVSPFQRVLAAMLAAFLVWAVLRFPVIPAAVAIALGVYALALARWPWLWLWVVPAALPLLDLAPYSGWFFLDEVDLVILTTLAVALWNGRVRAFPAALQGGGAWLSVVFGLSVLTSTLLGLLPLQSIDWNAFSNYYSHYNALRIAKGFLWPLLLLPVLLDNLRNGIAVPKHFTAGMILGLSGVTVLALWERYMYPGMFDYSRDFRVGTFFSSMHNGGASIEAYIVMATPFLAAGAYMWRSRLLHMAIAMLFIATTYVLMVTYSRGGYVAFAVAIALVMATSMRVAVLRRSFGQLSGLVAVSALALFVAIPIFFGSFAQQRIGTTFEDFDVRVSHWEDAVAMMDPGIVRQAFGMGLGRYPETFFFRNREGKRPATFHYETEGGNAYLRLGSGDRLYLEQMVDVAPNHDYRLALDVRAGKGPTEVNVLICERTYFHSYGCVSATVHAGATGAQWVRHEQILNSGRLGLGTWPARRPVKLSIENASAGNSVDIDNVSLRDANGTDLVANGDFSLGNARWFFSSKDHLAWHAKNLWIGLLFEQGWLGLLLFSMLIVYALVNLARNAWRGDQFAGAAFATVAGFLCVGLFDSLFEGPRLTSMFFLILLTAAATSKMAKLVTPQVTPQAALSAAALPAAAPGRTRSAGEPTPLAALAPKAAAFRTLAGIVVGAALIGAITHSSAVPYNLRNLPSPGHPIASLVLLAVFCYWIFAVPVWMACWFSRSRVAKIVFPGAIVMHGVVAWMIIHYAVYPLMIHKVTGSPVLGWPWWWEDLSRFAVLEGTLFLLLTGACTVVLIATGRAGLRQLFYWLAWATVLLPVAHRIIVIAAATDNLTELMADGGTTPAIIALAAWFVVLGAGASILAACFATRWHRVGSTVLLVALSIPLGYALAYMGTEQALLKFGTVFSGLQFLLSADREHYATGWQLGMRYVAFHAALLCGIALAQYPSWMMIPRQAPTAAGVRLSIRR